MKTIQDIEDYKELMVVKPNFVSDCKLYSLTYDKRSLELIKDCKNIFVINQEYEIAAYLRGIEKEILTQVKD